MCDAYSYQDLCDAQEAIRKRNIPPGFNGQPAPKPEVKNPHYTSRKIQPWDAMEEWMTPEQFKGFLLGNAIKYLGRCNFKNSYKDDLEKAQRYIEKLLNAG